jgi:hypothetical protein
LRHSLRAFEEFPESVEAFVQHPPVHLHPVLDILEASRAGAAPARPAHLLEILRQVRLSGATAAPAEDHIQAG